MAELDKLRTEMMNKSALIIQRCMRGYLARSYFKQKKAAVITLQVGPAPPTRALPPPLQSGSFCSACDDTEGMRDLHALSPQTSSANLPKAGWCGLMHMCLACRPAHVACWPASSRGRCGGRRGRCASRRPGAWPTCATSSSAPAVPCWPSRQPGAATSPAPWPSISGEPPSINQLPVSRHLGHPCGPLASGFPPAEHSKSIRGLAHTTSARLKQAHGNVTECARLTCRPVCARQQQATVLLQAAWRGCRERRRYLAYRRAVVVLQCCWRRKTARRELRRRRKEAQEAGKLLQDKQALDAKLKETLAVLETVQNQRNDLRQACKVWLRPGVSPQPHPTLVRTRRPPARDSGSQAPGQSAGAPVAPA